MNPDAASRQRAPRQLDLFLVELPPCGRRGCPRQGVIEHGQVHCNVCNCGVLLNPRATIFDGYIRSQLKDMEFLHEQAIAPGNDPGK